MNLPSSKDNERLSLDVSSFSSLDGRLLIKQETLGDFPKKRPVNNFTSKDRDKVARYLRLLGEDKLATKFSECGEDFAIFECYECGIEFSLPITCGLRICPNCRKRLRSELFEKHEPVIDDVRNPKHIVLTYGNIDTSLSPDEVRKEVKKLKKAFGKLRRRKLWKDRVRAGIYGLEVKERGDGYNLHIHIFADSYYIPQEKLSDLWEEISGYEVAYITKAGGKRGLSEVLSYSTKGSWFQGNLAMAKWAVATKGMRLVGAFGDWFNPSFAWGGKDYLECPVCGSLNIGFIEFWSERKRRAVSPPEPPPTYDELKSEELETA